VALFKNANGPLAAIVQQLLTTYSPRQLAALARATKPSSSVSRQ
jgi:hypothetical protein